MIEHNTAQNSSDNLLSYPPDNPYTDTMLCCLLEGMRMDRRSKLASHRPQAQHQPRATGTANHMFRRQRLTCKLHFCPDSVPLYA